MTKPADRNAKGRTTRLMELILIPLAVPCLLLFFSPTLGKPLAVWFLSHQLAMAKRKEITKEIESKLEINYNVSKNEE